VREPTGTFYAAFRQESEVFTMLEERMSPRRSDWSITGYTVLRVTVGIIMMAHGLTKLHDLNAWFGQVQSLGIVAPKFLGTLSVAAEFGGGLGLVLGLLTPLCAAAVLANMLVAIIKVHAGHGLMMQHGGFEYPLVLAAAAFHFALRGGGPLSIDGMLGRRWERHREEQHIKPDDLGPHFAH
jgi:putative oxidoreductase